MRTTLVYKQADLVMQLLALIIPAMAAISRRYTPFELFLTVIGIVQVLSCILNKVYLDPFLRNITRIGYEITLLLVALAFVIWSLTTYMPLGSYYFLLAFTPFMALWYFIITIREMLAIKRLVHRRDYM